MKVKMQQPQQNQNNIIPNPAWNSALDPVANQLDGGYRRDVERATISSEVQPSQKPIYTAVLKNTLRRPKTLYLRRNMCADSRGQWNVFRF